MEHIRQALHTGTHTATTAELAIHNPLHIGFYRAWIQFSKTRSHTFPVEAFATGIKVEPSKQQSF